MSSEFLIILCRPFCVFVRLCANYKREMPLFHILGAFSNAKEDGREESLFINFNLLCRWSPHFLNGKNTRNKTDLPNNHENNTRWENVNVHWHN